MIMRTPNLTQGYSDVLEHQIRTTHPGQAFFANSGLFGATCGDCASLGYHRQIRTRTATSPRRSVAAAARNSTSSPAIMARSCPHTRQRVGTLNAKRRNRKERRHDELRDVETQRSINQLTCRSAT